MSHLANRRAGLLYGSFIADALSLGVHWIYDPAALAKQHGRVTNYVAPDRESYHPRRGAGDQSHVGEQALALLRFLQREERWEADGFLADWREMWTGYDDYVDKATKGTLAHLAAGASAETCGAESNELAGPARLAPLAAFFAVGGEPTLVAAAREQTALTHRSPEAAEAAEFLARSTHRLLHGAPLAGTMRELAPAWAWRAAEAVRALPATEAIGQLGRACPIPQALPGVLYLTLRHGDDLETAFIENTMAGGDNCARGLALGMLLGAAHGLEAIPARWREGLRARPELESFLNLLP